jgi:hypothetical protein
MAKGFNLDGEIKRLQEINKERAKLYEEGRAIANGLKGLAQTKTASASEKTRIRNAVKPYTRTQKSKQQS